MAPVSCRCRPMSCSPPPSCSIGWRWSGCSPCPDGRTVQTTQLKHERAQFRLHAGRPDNKDGHEDEDFRIRAFRHLRGRRISLPAVTCGSIASIRCMPGRRLSPQKIQEWQGGSANRTRFSGFASTQPCPSWTAQGPVRVTDTMCRTQPPNRTTRRPSRTPPPTRPGTGRSTTSLTKHPHQLLRHDLSPGGHPVEVEAPVNSSDYDPFPPVG